MYQQLSTVLKTWFTPQRRRKSFPAAAAEIDCLERRQLLTLPEVIDITSAEIGDGGPFDQGRAVIVDWVADPNADSYEYWISDGRDNNHLDRLPTRGTVTENHLEVAAFPTFPGYEGRIWVRGLNEEGQGPWSAMERVVVPGGQLPGELDFGFVTPENSPVNLAHVKSFYLSSVSSLVFNIDHPDSYTQDTDAWLSRDGAVLSTDGRHLAPSGGGRRDMKFDYHVDSGGNIPDGLYRVWFRGRNGVGVSPWTEPVTIAVGASQPEITGPTSNAQPARPEIIWSAGVANVDYQIWIQPKGGSVLISERGISDTSYTPQIDLPDGVYYAFVRQASDSGAVLPWSSRFQFEVGTSTLPQRPTLTLVPNLVGDEIEDFRPLFQWANDPNAVRFDLYVAEGLNGTSVIRETELTGTSFLGSVLGTNGAIHYRAWLRAFGSDGTVTAWSEFVEFRVFSDGRVLPAGG